ncbi:MAG: ThiF family adenylyltransferase [Afipia sp.]|nr:ThiF family adenylyltransferase [Afipia sp.]
MTRSEDIGDRHLRATEGFWNAALSEKTVRIVVAAGWERSVAGQLMTSCLVNLLCRQIGIVGRIELVARTAPRLITLPSYDEREFPLCLASFSQWAVDGKIDISLEVGDAAPDFVVDMGGASGSEFATSYRLCALASGWRAWLGSPQNAPLLAVPESRNPLGPFLAAALCAGEIFKHARGMDERRGSFLVDAGYSLWSGQGKEPWSTLRDGPELAGKTLAPLYMVGAGAVGNGIAYVVANAAFKDSYSVLVDNDIYDETSLNRCVLAGWQDVGNVKVDAVERYLKATHQGCFPSNRTLTAFLDSEPAGLRADVAEAVRNSSFGIVLSCVDKGTSRQHIQGMHPKLLIGGSTLDMGARTNFYSGAADAACLACHNPREKDGERIQEQIDRLRRMSAEERAVYLKDNALSADAADFIDNPRCGTEGEAELAAFATKGPTLFSVGFVSLAAALLSSASLFQRMLFPGQVKRSGMTSLHFMRGGMMDSELSQDEHCERGHGVKPPQKLAL